MEKLWKKYSYAIILILLSFTASIILSFRFDTFQQHKYIKLTVSEGDSLYKIADQFKEEQKLSRNEFVSWVQRHNNIDGDIIYPGQKIIIPISSQSEPMNEFASAAVK